MGAPDPENPENAGYLLRDPAGEVRMLFLLVLGVFALVAPTWIICACGLGDFEDETGLQWCVRIVGLICALFACYMMFFRPR